MIGEESKGWNRKGRLIMKVRELTKSLEHIVYEVTLEPSEVEKRTERAYMALAMRFDLKPETGKSSRETVEEHLDPVQIGQYVSSTAIDQTWQLAVDQTKAHIIGIPECTYDEAYERGKEFRYIIDAVRRPVFELSSYKPVQLHKSDVEVTEADIDDYIARETKRFMVSAPDPDAADARVAADSFVSIAMETKKNDEAYAPLTFDERDYELGVGDMPDGFDEHLVGLKCGDVVSFEFEGPDLANANKGIAMPATFSTTVTIKGMLKRVLPKVTDEWVREHVKNATSVEQMRKRVHDEVMKSKREEDEQFCRYLAAVQVGDRLEGEISDAVFEAAYGLAASQFQTAMRNQGMTAQDYYKKHDTNAQEFAADLMMQTRSQLKQQFALDAVAAHEHMELSDEDMREYYALIEPGKEDELAKRVAEAGQVTQTREAALRMKANAWLVETSVEPED